MGYVRGLPVPSLHGNTMESNPATLAGKVVPAVVAANVSGTAVVAELVVALVLTLFAFPAASTLRLIPETRTIVHTIATTDLMIFFIFIFLFFSFKFLSARKLFYFMS
jgi:hypothetical protein